MENKKPVRGVIVEDELTSGGVDAVTGAPVIKAKTVDKRADESMVATDPNERRTQPKQ